MKNKSRKGRLLLVIIAAIFIIGLLIPQTMIMPVEGAGRRSYSQDSWWAYPWGKSVTHKGVDIFAKEGTPVHAATDGLVVFAGQNKLGGNVVFVLGPKWRLHYYAHLKEIDARPFHPISRGGLVGTVGTTGDAKGKPSHLHYQLNTLIPYFWRMDRGIQGWKKFYYLNPIPYLNDCLRGA